MGDHGRRNSMVICGICDETFYPLTTLEDAERRYRLRGGTGTEHDIICRKCFEKYAAEIQLMEWVYSLMTLPVGEPGTFALN